MRIGPPRPYAVSWEMQIVRVDVSWPKRASVERHEHDVERPADHVLGAVALAVDVLDEHDLAGLDDPNHTVAGGDLGVAVELHDVLPARGGVPVQVVGDRHLAEDDAAGVLAAGCWSAWGHLGPCN